MISRLKRLKRHVVTGGISTIRMAREQSGLLGMIKACCWYMLETCFLLADCLHIPELLVGANRALKPNTRRLTAAELACAREIFGANIDYSKVLLDEGSIIGCRQFQFAYVGFTVINCWGSLSPAHFIHELVHVWQYQQVGSVYIPRALQAQRTTPGYDYGGIKALHLAIQNAGTFHDFNYEQQGDIVSDYYCLKNGVKPRWCTSNPEYIPVFEALLKPVFPR